MSALPDSRCLAKLRDLQALVALERRLAGADAGHGHIQCRRDIDQRLLALEGPEISPPLATDSRWHDKALF